MKLLFTSIGRRVELIQAFYNAAKKLHVPLTIIGADIVRTAPALAFCDETVIVPRIKESSYIPFLIDYCNNHTIDALIPTIDTELLVLSQNKNNFGNTKVIISGEEKILLCRDKQRTVDYFNSIGLKSPHSVNDYRKYDSVYPAFIKPKDGSSSIFAYKVNNAFELIEFAKRVPDYIVQPYIEGTEYTVDIFCDFDGSPVFITPRVRLAVRAGEVLKTRIEQDSRIIHEMEILVERYKPVGQITVQLIREKSTGDDYYIEINPRFGGGAPLSIKAGADSAEMLIRLINGEKIGYQKNVAEDGA